MGLGYYIYCKNCYPNHNIHKKDTDNVYYSIYQIYTGRGFFSFLKEQLEDNYNELLNEDQYILEKVNTNLKNNYKFDDVFGRLPFYCENCMILDEKMYFEMTKENKKYIPEYKCKLCGNTLKSVLIAQETLDLGTWAQCLKKNNVGDLKLFTKNNRINIVDKEENIYKLKCRKCNNGIYLLNQCIHWD
jgi:hypothetical protein